MQLMNDVARCQGEKIIGRFVDEPIAVICDRRETCARYVERKHGGPRTMTYANLCCDGDDSYIPAEKQNDSH